MARILFMCMVSAVVDLIMMSVFLYTLVWGEGAARACLVVVIASVLHALLTPSPEDRAELHAFLKITAS